jgi:hypothetical protein
MARKVSLSQNLAYQLLELRRRAREIGLGDDFRMAWDKIWQCLNTRPLPPDESDEVFGEIQFTTPHEPRHRICIAAIRPLAIHFAVYYDISQASSEPQVFVTIIRATAMFE